MAIKERPLNLVDGNFPLDLGSGSAGVFERTRLNILTLNKTPGIFNLLPAHQDRQFTAQRPFFYQDDRRVFIVLPEDKPAWQSWSQAGTVSFEGVTRTPSYYREPVPPRDPVIAPAPGDLLFAEPSQEVQPAAPAETTSMGAGILPRRFTEKRYRFQTFYHPYVCPFLRELNRNGIDGLLQRPVQVTPEKFLVPPQTFDFNASYEPEPIVELPHPIEDVDFSYSGTYSSYNWELFFHAPVLIADRLSKNQRFEEAQKWFHYIFDPTDTSGHPAPQKFWRTRPFFETTTAQYQKAQLQNLLQRLTAGNPDPEVQAQVKRWRQDPFKPHLIARMRTTAYQKAVVMKYLDNLIAWGDQLFGRDTIESINEATQLYILALHVLGRRPENIKPRITPPAHTFNTLEPLLDDFSNALVQVENVISVAATSAQRSGAFAATPPPLNLAGMFYFCVPKNDKLLGYWDKLSDRLFKIRHCMNIEGIVRQLPLFEPRIDPALLVRAAAAGLDISSALNDLNAALPHYRFNVMAQKAGEVCAELKALGAGLLAAVEKRDAETVALLRSAQEIKVLNAVRQVRQRQVDEAREALEGVKKSRDVVAIRRDYYANIQYLNTEEKAHLALSDTALDKQTAQAQIELVLNILALFPNLKFGAPTTLGTTFGGNNLAAAGRAFSSHLGATANILHTRAGLSATIGGHKRRADEWKFQARLADKELEQFDKQILAGEIRLAVADLELKNQDLQIENAKEMDVFLHDKFTNRELYDWMVSQISGIYFQSYQLTYDLAKRAERAYRFELGLADSSFIQFGYWDSLRKGLLAGERLFHDLKRMEAAYLDLNRREFELTKHVSLALLDPLALVKLRETGRCFLRLPEEIFDLDYPGHYFRRIRSMSLTLPCVTGPYTTIPCTLRLLKNSVRINTAQGDQYARNSEAGLPAGDARFVENSIPVKAIASSSAQNDSGMFELSFRDERYLPFEGAGAISEWSLELFSDTGLDFGKPLRQFDYDTISDAILHIKYTAREDAGPFRTRAVQHLGDYYKDATTPSLRMFNLRQDFPSQWSRFLNPTIPANGNIFEFEMSPDLFRSLDAGKTLKINTIYLLARCTPAGAYIVLSPPPPAPPLGSNTIALVASPAHGGLYIGQSDLAAQGITVAPSGPPVTWQIKMTFDGHNLQQNQVDDVLLVLGYEWE
jgi:hypothetical protein